MVGWHDLTFERDKKECLSKKKRKNVDSDTSFGEDSDEKLDCYHHKNMTYPKYKYRKMYPPTCMYNPSEEIIVKIIRSCLYIDKIEDLVFYNKQ